jgi:hypothetical protein
VSRVLILLVLVSTGLTPIGARLTGFVSDAFGIRVALLVNGGSVVAGGPGLGSPLHAPERGCACDGERGSARAEHVLSE